MSMGTDLVETWEINNRIGLYLLDSIPQEDLGLKGEKGRTISGQFRHMHQVRMMWLKAAAPNLLEGLEKVESDTATKAEVASALEASGKAIATMIEENSGEGQRVKGFKPTTTAFVAYLISHESHHRGMAELSLRQAGRPISDKISYGLWEWGSR